MLRQVLFRPRSSGLVQSPSFRAIHISARMRIENDINRRVEDLEKKMRELEFTAARRCIDNQHRFFDICYFGFLSAIGVWFIGYPLYLSRESAYE